MSRKITINRKFLKEQVKNVINEIGPGQDHLSWQWDGRTEPAAGWKFFAKVMVATYNNSVDIVNEILNRNLRDSIQLPGFEVFFPAGTDNIEKLFYKIMKASIKGSNPQIKMRNEFVRQTKFN